MSRWFKFLAIIKFDKFNIYYKKIYSLLPNISLVNANLVFYMIFIFFCRDEAKPKFGGIFVGYADKECWRVAAVAAALVAAGCGWLVSATSLSLSGLALSVSILPLSLSLSLSFCISVL